MYLFAGGGTGGHLFPGIAVAEELKRRSPNCSFLFAGSEREVERRILADAGFPHAPLSAEPLTVLRRNPFRFFVRNWSAWREARRIVRNEQPAAVIGLGGFASVPLVLAARRAGVPVVLLEQNVLAGSANRWLARRAQAVCVSFAESASDLPRGASVVVTGNPLRRSVAELAQRPHPADEAKSLLILGGSQGARTVNDAALATIVRRKSDFDGWHIVHQTGIADCDRIRAGYTLAGIAATVEPFFGAIEELYRAASLVIARAGATTLAELACAGRPTILIPYRHAARDHQVRNAEIFAEAGAATVVRESTDPVTTASDLDAQLVALLQSPADRRRMAEAMRRLARQDATASVADVIERTVRQSAPRQEVSP